MLYAGVDYHKRYSQVHVIDEHGRTRASAVALSEALRSRSRSSPNLWLRYPMMKLESPIVRPSCSIYGSLRLGALKGVVSTPPGRSC